MNVIQGQNAILSIFKEEFIPFVCASDISIQITSGKVPIRTVGDGQWQKYTYQDLSYAITLSGVMVFDSNNWTGWDALDNQLNFLQVQFRISYQDDEGDIKSLQGQAMIETSSLKVTMGDVVKGDFGLQGNGALMYFDGLIPCDTTINTITVTGQTASDGIAHIAYTYTGAVYQVKYRIDSSGDYTYSLVGTPIAIPGLSLGSHSIEIIPICANDYEGNGAVQSFVMAGTLTCTLAVSSITVTPTGSNASVSVAFGASPTGSSLKYSVDGGPFVYYIGTLTNPTVLPTLTGLAIGAHTIQCIPVCGNGAQGTGMTQSFNITSSSTLSTVNWSYTVFPPGSTFQVFKNGTLVASGSGSNASGSFTANSGDTIHAQLSTSQSGRTGTLTITDTTISSVLHNNSYTTSSPATVSDMFTFTATGGDSYTINGTVSP